MWHITCELFLLHKLRDKSFSDECVFVMLYGAFSYKGKACDA